MAYGSAKGRIFRGDIYAAEDTNQDTYIDWGNDFISFGVGGVKVLNVSASDTLVQVLGNVSASLNITASGHVSASTFYGDGSNLKGVTTSPASPTNAIQFNNAGAFGGTTNLRWDGSGVIISGTLSASSDITGTSFYVPTTPGFTNDYGFYGNNLVSPASSDLTIKVGPATTNTEGIIGLSSAGSEKLRIQLNNLAAGGDSNDVLIASQLGNIVLKNGPPGTGQTTISGSLSASLNITASAFYGDGANLTNLPAGAPAAPHDSVQFNNAGALGGSSDFKWENAPQILTVSGSLSASLNITASAFYGDGANLTNLPGGTPGGSTIELQYNNGGVFDGAPDLKYVSAGQRRFVVGDSGFITTMTGALHVTGAGGLGFGTLFSVGNSVAGSGSIFTVTGSGRVGINNTDPNHTLAISGSVSASSNISASAFYGSAANLTNMPAAYPNKTIQFNNLGELAGSGALTWNGTKVIVSGSVSASLAVSSSEAYTRYIKTGNPGYWNTVLSASSLSSSNGNFTISPDGKIILDGKQVANQGEINLRNNGVSYGYFRSSSYNNTVAMDFVPEGIKGVTIFSVAAGMGNEHQSLILDPTGSSNGGVQKGLVLVSGSLTASHNISASAFYGDGSNLTNLPGGEGGIFTTLGGSGGAYTTSSIRVVSAGQPSASLYVSASAANAGPLLRVDAATAGAILFVTGSGRVGIGTTSPARTLEIVDPTSAAFQLTALNARGAGQDNSYSFISDGYGFSIFDTTTGGTPGYRFLIADGGGATTRGYVAIGDGAGMGGSNYPTAQLHVSSSDGGPTFRVDGELANPALFVTGSGRVGIGTATPGTTLDILGTTLADQLRLGHGGTHYYKMGRATDGFFHIQGTQQDYTGYIFKDALGNGSGALVTIGNSLALNVHYTGSGNPTYLDDDKGGGEVVYFGTSSASGLQPGALYYLNADGGWASASAQATGDDPVNGGGQNQLLALALGHQPEADGMLLRGYFHADSYYQKDFGIGKPVYVSTSSAHFKAYLPTASANFARVIGYGTSRPNVIYFNPDSTYEVI